MSDRLEQARREAEERMTRLRESLDREVGLLSPKSRGAWIVLAAGAAGLALALGLAAKTRRKRAKQVGSKRARPEATRPARRSLTSDA